MKQVRRQNLKSLVVVFLVEVISFNTVLKARVYITDQYNNTIILCLIKCAHTLKCSIILAFVTKNYILILERTEVTTMRVGATIQPPVTQNDDGGHY